jgi:hypothetical protein
VTDPLKGFRFSEHFLERALDMQLTPEQIRDTLLDPENLTRSKKYPDCWNHKRGDICLAVSDPKEDGRRVVVTAIWRTREAWERDIALGGYEDRECRKQINLPERAR